MSELITAQRRSIRFYAFGGAGSNNLRAYLENHPRKEGLLGDESYCFIDTSLSNLVGVDRDKVFHIKAPDGTPLDGAGGDRSLVAAAATAALPEILRQFPPAEKNIFVFSLTGGSGPTIGHVMALDFLKKGLHAAGVTVRSSESTKRIDTGIKVLGGFEAVVKATNRPFIISIHENDESLSRDQNNIAPSFDLAALSILCSGLNESMDSADTAHLFDYHKVTHHQPAVALLHIAADIDKIKAVKAPIIAYAAVARHRDETIPKIAADYDTAGYMRDTADEKYNNSFYYAVSQASAAELFKDLIAQGKELENNKQVKSPVVSLMDGLDQTGDASGMVF